MALAAAAVVLGLAFAGSPAKLAEGVHIAGIDVGGLTPGEARRLLERRSTELADVPVTFVAGQRRWQLTPAQLGVTVDWSAAVAAAQQQGQGFGPVRGFRRLHTRVFGADVAPPTRVSDPALTYAVGEIAKSVDRPPRQAALARHGLELRIVPGVAGRALDRSSAEALVVRSLAAFSRSPVGLPVQVTPPAVTGGGLRPALRQARVALSAPIRLDLGGTRWRLPRGRIAELLALPRDGKTTLAVGGPRAERYLERVATLVERPSRDASFEALADGSVRVVPHAEGLALDRLATATSILAAAVSPTRRLAHVEVRAAEPELTTAEAKAMGIARLLSSYSTDYAGTADRIHNLRLAVSFLDGALVAPGATFSFNERVGERTEERGFRAAPVIIDGEYEDGIGGGVSQVATTTFNAVWEAGLKITARAPHALYIGRYPLGRDATVNYPDLDLRFANDTSRWILVRAVATSSGITVNLYGAPTGRRVVSEAGPLAETAPPPLKRIVDPTLEEGTVVVDAEGEPSRAVTVTRTVYEADGDVLYNETWQTKYRGEPRIVRVGTKPKPKPKPEGKDAAKDADEKAPPSQPGRARPDVETPPPSE